MRWLPDSPARAAGLVTALFGFAVVLQSWPGGGLLISAPLVAAGLFISLAMAHKVTRNPKPTVGVLRSTRRPGRDESRSTTTDPHSTHSGGP